MNATDMRETIEAVVAACVDHPEKSASDVLVEIADSRCEDAKNCVLVTYKIRLDQHGFDRFEAFELIQRAWWDEFERRCIIGNKPIIFRGINSDGSDVIRTWDKLDAKEVRRGWHADEVADVAVAMLMHPDAVDMLHLYRMVSDYACAQQHAMMMRLYAPESSKRVECEDAEVSAAKRVAAETD